MLPVRRAGVLAIAFVGLVAAVQAVPQNRVDDLVAKNLEARGGIDRLKDTFSIKQTATMTMPMMGTEKATTTVYLKRPNLMRQETRVGGKTVINAFDGETAWIVNPLLGSERPIIVSGPQAEMVKEQSSFDGPLVDYKSHGFILTAEGAETAGDRTLIHLKLVSATKQVRHLYLDSVTYLDAKLTTEQGQMKLDQEFLDYRLVDGRNEPHLIRTLMNGAVQSEIRIQKIEFNKEMDDSLFRIPKGF